MTTDRIAEIRARADAATPGHWGTDYDGNGTYYVHSRLRTEPGAGMVSDGVVARLQGEHGDSQTYHNARFAAHAREDVPYLLNRVAEQERPRRGDVFEAWLKAQRDASADHPEAYQVADGLLDLYRLHADTGTPLGEHVCEGRVAGDCECLEVPA